MLVPPFYASHNALRIRVSPIYFPGQNPLDHACRWNSSTVEDGGKGTCETSQRKPVVMPKHVAIYGVDLYGDPQAVYGKTPGPVEENTMSVKGNRISATIAPADKTAILQKVQEIWALLNFLVNVTTEEKQSLPSVAEKREGMDVTFIHHMTERPEIVPTYVNMPEVLKDLALRKDLSDIIRPVQQLLEALIDTRFLASNDNYMAYLATYNNTQMAADRNVPGMNTILPDLARYFSRNPTPATPTPATPTPTP